MFTDQPVTPLRLEILVEAVGELGGSGTLRREAILELLQPETLPDYNSDAGEPRSAAKEALKAAIDLGLVIEDAGLLRLSDTAHGGSKRRARDKVLAAIDERVLGAVDIETYFAPFYSFMLAQDPSTEASRDYQDWANLYNAAVYAGTAPRNPLNQVKVRGLLRWYPYVGLGWNDPSGEFQCEPYERLNRALPKVFGDDRRLAADDFISRLALACPELDHGEFFRFANRGAVQGKMLTTGLAQALISLHQDGQIVLHCPPDSPGWDLSAAAPPNDGAAMRSDRLGAVEWGTAPSRRTAPKGKTR